MKWIHEFLMVVAAACLAVAGIGFLLCDMAITDVCSEGRFPEHETYFNRQDLAFDGRCLDRHDGVTIAYPAQLVERRRLINPRTFDWSK